jgi:hypothetical protein
MMGLFELLILVGVIYGLTRFLRSRPFREKILSVLRRARSIFGKRRLLFYFFFCFGMALLIGGASSHRPSEPLMFFGLLIQVVLIVWGTVRWLRPASVESQWKTCPSIGLLKDLLAERLPSPVQGRLAAHLENCIACQHRVEGLTAGQRSWPFLARKLSEHPPAPEPALRKVMERLKEDKEEETRDEPVFAGDLPLDFLSPSDKPGQLGRLERYEVLEEIGRGGMGVVLKAFDPSLHRVVAIKVLAPQLATSGVARKRFLREAKAAAAVTHDHIVTIHAVDEANGLPYLVMHYIAGQSLQQRIDKEGPLELTEVLRIGMQTASGLAAAHGQGIVHRDIKPANILLEDGVQRVKITDFGLARAMDDASLTQSGFVAGSPLYMAPEQARGEALDHRADLFSLGSVLYTMCTGRPPFRAANTLAVLRRVSEDVPRPIRETNPEIPDWLVAVIEKLMAKEPADRYQSAGEVVEALGKQLAQMQHAAWVPPPAPSPASAEAGLPTSLTICPSCGTSLYVPETMVGGLVHCAECGKPFQAEDGSEVIQVAQAVKPPFGRRRAMARAMALADFWGRAVKPPFGPGFRPRRKLRGCLWIAGGCAALLFLFVLSMIAYHESRSVAPPMSAKTTGSRPAESNRPLSPQERWAELNGLPAEATLFGAIRFPQALTLDDAWTQAFLHLLGSGETADQLTSENLGRIKIQALALGYYEGAKSKDATAIVHLTGTALDGHKRIVEHIRRHAREEVRVEEMDKRLAANGPVCLSGPELPFALKIVDDHHAYLAACLSGDATATQHRKVLDGLPSGQSIPAGYNPPWIMTAVVNVPSNAWGFLLGEIPAEVRKLLTESLKLRACPRTFTLTATREGDGIVLSLTLNVEKAGTERSLRDDLVQSRPQAYDVLSALFPTLRHDREAAALLKPTLNNLRWETSGGNVRTKVRITSSTWKALRDLLKRAG